MCKIIAIANQKGGVAKTTTTMSIAAALTQLGYKVLMVDFDPQGNLTHYCGLEKDTLLEHTIATAIKNTIYGRETDDKKIVWRTTERLWVIPANTYAAALELDIAAVPDNPMLILSKYLSHFRKVYDYILIDCGPSLGLLTINALTAADSVLIPITAEVFAIEGLQELISTIRRIKAQFNPILRYEGILFTKMNKRLLLSKQIQADVKEIFGKTVPIFEEYIPLNVKLCESTGSGNSIFSYDPSNNAGAAYMRVAEEITKHE